MELGGMFKPRVENGNGFSGVKRVNVQEGDRACSIPKTYLAEDLIRGLGCKIPQQGIQSPPCSDSSQHFSLYILLLLSMNLVLQTTFSDSVEFLGSQKYPGNQGAMASRFEHFTMLCPASSSWCFPPFKLLSSYPRAPPD